MPDQTIGIPAPGTDRGLLLEPSLWMRVTEKGHSFRRVPDIVRAVSQSKERAAREVWNILVWIRIRPIPALPR